MQVGQYRVSVHNHGFFRLDGGAMFGSVPRTIWSKAAPPDDDNRVLLATRSLIIEDGDRKMLVDVGCGDKWNAKSRAIFCISAQPYVSVEGVTDVLLTHLHFDHAGGVSRFSGDAATVEPCYPKARHYVSSANLENAKRPNVRERASYLAENIDVLEQVDLHLVQAEQEIWPGITVHQSDGHTRGLLWVKVNSGGQTVAFPADLIPTFVHLPIPYVMGYDICAEQAMKEKEAFLNQAIEESWIVVFEHDPTIGAARLTRDDRGRPQMVEEIDLSE